jgi:hypothetical protein
LEYDFTVIYKLDKMHSVTDALSRLSHEVEMVGVLDQMTNAILFSMHIDWLHEVKEFLYRRVSQRLPLGIQT